MSIAVQSMAVNQIANALEDGPVSSELHDLVDAEISRHLRSQTFVATLKSERAYGIDSFRDFRGLGLPGSFKRDECDYLKRMAAEIRIGELPRYKIEEALAQMDANTQGAGKLTQLVVPALEAAREAHQRSRARLQCLGILNELTRAEKEQGANAPSIDDLRLPEEMKIDPYNGQRLKIKRIEGRWLVYSVGLNLKDDGGKMEKNEDIGVGPDES